MEEGTYGSPIYQPPGSGPPVSRTATPPASAFKANVARKKTRKWVEARKINYDGSGWGDEDEDDEDEEDESGSGGATPSDQAPPPMPSLGTPRLPSASLPSQQQQHQPPLHAAHALPSMAASRSATPSSLHARGSPSPARQPSPAADVVPAPWADRTRTASPLGPRAQSPASAARRNFVRPSDIYKRAAASPPEDAAAPSAASAANNSEQIDVVARGRTMATTATPAPVAPAAATPPAPAFTAPPSAGTPTYSVFPKASPTRTIVTGPVEPSPTTPNPVAASPAAAAPAQVPAQVPAQAPAQAPAPPPKDSPLPPLPTPQATPQASAPPPAAHRPQDSIDSTSAASEASGATHEDEALHRFSTSPKLPDLARFSTFSPELLFGGSSFLSPTDAPPVPSLPTSPAVATFPKDEGGPAVAETTPAQAATPPNQTDPVETGTTDISPPPEEDRQTPTQQHQQQQTGSISSASDGASALRDSSATVTTGITAPVSEGARQSAGDGSLALPTDTGAKEAIEPAGPEVAGASPDDGIPTTAPLNPRRSSHLFLSDAAAVSPVAAAPATTVVLPHYDAAPLHSMDMESPIKETDILSDEIIRTLSPVGMTAEPEPMAPGEGIAAAGTPPPPAAAPQTAGESGGASAPALAATRGLERARTPTRESSYLQSVYDDYLPADGDDDHEAGGESGEAHAPPPAGAPVATAAAAATAAVAAGAAAAAATAASATAPLQTTAPTGEPSTAPAASAPMVASVEARDAAPVAAPAVLSAPSAEASGAVAAVATAPADGARPGLLRRQFSWEMAAEDKETAPEPPQPAHPALQDPSPAEHRRPSVASVSDEEEEVAAAKEKEETSAAAKASPATETETVAAPQTPTPAAPAAPPPLRSMLDVDDGPPPAARAPPPAAAQQQSQPQQQQQYRVSMAASSLSPTQSLRTVRTGQSGVGAPSAAQHASLPPAQHQILTLKQCMAFNTHEERMAKLAQARREYALADSGLTAWLTAMTTAAPDYRAPFASVWGAGGGGGGGDAASVLGAGGDETGGGLGLSPSVRRPVGSHVPHVPHVPHVSMPSSTQISHKSKELLAATGKAGKGLLALRKKGFHKKATS